MSDATSAGAEAAAGRTRFLVLVLRLPAFDPAGIVPHRAFLDALRAEGRLALAGPFGDGSGGAYLLWADDEDEARAIAHRDPLHLAGSSRIEVRAWHAA
ncbi:MAG: YciI family protein [Lysobacteraceae bacterium]